MSDKTLHRVDLHDITVTHNPRCPARGLARGLVAEGVEDSPIALVHRLALSDNAADRAEFCRLVEKYESVPKGLVELAASRRKQELQPISLRSFRSQVPGTKPVEYVQRYGLVMGERRYLAAAYNYAKHGESCDIGALFLRVTVDEAYDLAVAENLQRQDMSDVEIGHVFREYYDEGMTIKEVAAHLNQDYQYVRGRLGLTYLTPAEQQAVEDGRLGVTKAVEKGLAVKSGKANSDEQIDPKADSRRRVATLKAVEAEFDATPRNRKGYLAGLAWVMGLDLETALDESELRIAEAMEKEAKKAA